MFWGQNQSEYETVKYATNMEAALFTDAWFKNKVSWNRPVSQLQT